MRRKKRKKKKTVGIIFLLVIFIIFISIISAIILGFLKKAALQTSLNINEKHEINTPIIEANKEDKKDKITKQIILSSVGDCTIGTDDKFYKPTTLPTIVYNNNDMSYLFKNVADIFKSDDITIANLETTFTNATSKSDKQFTFKAPPEFAKSLNLGYIEGVNLSNNHIYDYQKQGFDDTINTLKENNINFFGEGYKWLTTVKDVKFAFLGYQGWWYDNTFLKNLKNNIVDLKAEGYIVVINFHWGEENQYTPNATQKYLAHFSIDNGADLIIGHHPHVVQGIEKYKDKYIAYSLGNFCFGGNSNPQDKDTFILQTSFKIVEEKLTSIGIKVIPCSISSVKNINDYSPTPLSGEEKARVLEKINNLSINLDEKINDDFYFINLN